MKLKSLAGLLCAGVIITGGIVGDINWPPNSDTSIISIGDEAYAKRRGRRSGRATLWRFSSRSSSESQRSSQSSRSSTPLETVVTFIFWGSGPAVVYAVHRLRRKRRSDSSS